MLVLSIIVPIVFIFLYSLISQLSTTNPIAIAQHSEDAASKALTTIMKEMEIEDGPYYEIMTLDPDKARSEEHTSELQSRGHLVCRLLLEKKKNRKNKLIISI